MIDTSTTLLLSTFIQTYKLIVLTYLWKIFQVFGTHDDLLMTNITTHTTMSTREEKLVF